jgi:hypothetical protein
MIFKYGLKTSGDPSMKLKLFCLKEETFSNLKRTSKPEKPFKERTGLLSYIYTLPGRVGWGIQESSVEQAGLK